MIPHWQLLLRIGVAALLGGAIGLERNIHRRQAGFRTHLIVATASATFMVVSAQFLWFQHYVPGNLVAVDTSRIAASVVAGVGFLGGGSILRTGATVQGLTTAAALWLVAAVGLCCGSGMFQEGVFATALGLLSLTALRFLEDKHMTRRKITLTLEDVAAPIESITVCVDRLGAQILSLDYHRDIGARRITVTFDLVVSDSLKLPALISTLEQLAGLQDVQIRAP